VTCEERLKILVCMLSIYGRICDMEVRKVKSFLPSPSSFVCQISYSIFRIDIYKYIGIIYALGYAVCFFILSIKDKITWHHFKVNRVLVKRFGVKNDGMCIICFLKKN